ncbi:hypothetical protein HG66A1_00850 [Gimesia chilikensis]|uniref:Uncharacterized protein n=1 Tax=Gimesia chilikensis TaxID=2605989 RepID=A0A517PG15_9PLAN|nr:hypothetical protein HG66A1_00850 [Gimesia chilikensis]
MPLMLNTFLSDAGRLLVPQYLVVGVIYAHYTVRFKNIPCFLEQINN